MNFRKLAKDFILHEGSQPSPTALARVEALEELIKSIKIVRESDKRKIHIIFSHLKELKKELKKNEAKLKIYQESEFLENE